MAPKQALQALPTQQTGRKASQGPQDWRREAVGKISGLACAVYWNLELANQESIQAAVTAGKDLSVLIVTAHDAVEQRINELP